MPKFPFFLAAVLALMAPVTSWAASVSANLAITVTPPSGSGSAQVPGPSLTLYNTDGTVNSPYYQCTTNKYVSPTGNSGNTGNTVGSPWDMPTALAANLGGGTCFNLTTGSYSSGSSQTIAHGGTTASTTGYVVWRCSAMPFSFSSGGALQGEGSGCVFTGPGGGEVFINPNIAYVMFDGIEIDGVNFANTDKCLTNEAGTGTHHIWLMNSDIHGCGQSGWGSGFTDWVFAIHNVIHDNSGNNGFHGSGLTHFEPIGLTAYTPTTQDKLWLSATTGVQYHIVTAYNVFFHNHEPQSGTGNTDGNGVIYDNWGWQQMDVCSSFNIPSQNLCPYPFSGLIMGNISYFNGGGGIKAVQFNNGAKPTPGPPTGHIAVVNNTTYNNYWDSHNISTQRGEIDWEESFNTLFENNIAISVSPALCSGGSTSSCPFAITSDGPNISSNTLTANFSMPVSDTLINNGAVYNSPPNHDGTNPNLTSLTPSSLTNNFVPAPGSPVIGAGVAFDLWQQSGTIDAGACVSSLTHCP